MFNGLRRLMLIMGVLSCSIMGKAQEKATESLFPNADRPLSTSHFTWGAEFGTSIDLTGYDTSTVNLDLVFGYKNSYLDLLGLGAGVHRSVGTGDNFVPIYAVIHTDFSKRKRPFFMAVKAGYSFNTMGNAPTFGDIAASLGGGINLAVSRKFTSYIILAYEFRHFNKRHRESFNILAEDISLATLSIGVTF